VVRHRLQQLSPEELQRQSASVQRRVLQSAWFRQARSVAVYLSMPSGECVTGDLVQAILHPDSGKKCYVPKMRPDGRMSMLRVHSLADLHSFPTVSTQRFTIAEPPDTYMDQPREDVCADMPGSDLDLVLAPGLAFDGQGGRLGKGKGYYDRFLNEWDKLTDKRPLLVVGLGLSCQRVDAVPMEPLDHRIADVVWPDEEHGAPG
jgi:5-formyltetrahydrofolate cyclo-ligase